MDAASTASLSRPSLHKQHGASEIPHPNRCSATYEHEATKTARQQLDKDSSSSKGLQYIALIHLIFWAHLPELVSKLGEPDRCRLAPAMQTPCMFKECVRCMCYAHDAMLISTAMLHDPD